jgi:hypothetical protein
VGVYKGLYHMVSTLRLISTTMQIILVVYQTSTVALHIAQVGDSMYCNCHSTCSEGVGQIALTLAGINSHINWTRT